MTAPLDEKLPELQDGVLSDDQLLALFRDYRACATIGEILIKSGPGHVAADSHPSLEQAEDLLRARRVRGVQIRYQFDRDSWCDTLIPIAEGVRLVRIRQSP